MQQKDHAPGQPFTVVTSSAATTLEREGGRRFTFRVPPRWRSPNKNPYAADAEAHVLGWFKTLGCSPTEVARAARFDAAGYVGIPFPSLSREKTYLFAKYLSLWLLWDDVDVETLANRWRIEADGVLLDERPEGMTRFDEGWWALMSELGSRRSHRWLGDLCATMRTWDDAAMGEAVAMQERRDRGALPTFEEQLEMRIATIGMYATVYLLEDAYEYELPPSFHASPTVRRLKKLANKIVGLGNDILSFGKDWQEDQINLATTLMHERAISIDAALECLVKMHDAALEEYDAFADTVSGFPAEAAPYVERWLQDVRYASLGFSLWESQAPRYTAYKVVANGRVIEPSFSFFPARRRSTMPPGAAERTPR